MKNEESLHFDCVFNVFYAIVYFSTMLMYAKNNVK